MWQASCLRGSRDRVETAEALVADEPQRFRLVGACPVYGQVFPEGPRTEIGRQTMTSLVISQRPHVQAREAPDHHTVVDYG